MIVTREFSLGRGMLDLSTELAPGIATVQLAIRYTPGAENPSPNTTLFYANLTYISFYYFTGTWSQEKTVCHLFGCKAELTSPL